MEVGWGSTADTWQRAAGAGAMHPRLFEALGGEARPSGDRFGLSGQGPAFQESMAGSLSEEVPRIFSMAGQAGIAGDLQGDRGLFGVSSLREAQAQYGGGDPALLPQQAGALPYGDPCWVTVFGYPGRAASLVRQQLEALCGPILEIRHGDGNFMHVRFPNPSAANMCLAQNGRPLLGGKIMIGCVPCTSGLLAASPGLDDLDGSRPPLLRAEGTTRLPWALSAGALPGPKVTTGGLFQRLADALFDI